MASIALKRPERNRDRSKQVDAIQFALVACGHGDLVFGDLLALHQVLLQHLDRHLLVLGLRLEQDDGSDVRCVLLGFLSQRRP